MPWEETLAGKNSIMLVNDSPHQLSRKEEMEKGGNSYHSISEPGQAAAVLYAPFIVILRSGDADAHCVEDGIEGHEQYGLQHFATSRSAPKLITVLLHTGIIARAVLCDSLF